MSSKIRLIKFHFTAKHLGRLTIGLLPITIGLIFLLLYTAFDSLKYAALIITNVPFAAIGGVLALFISQQYLSVPAAVGFIGVFGVAMLNGIVLISFLRSLQRQRHSTRDVVVEEPPCDCVRC